MNSDGQTFLSLIAPTVFVLGAIYALGSVLPTEKAWARYAIFALVWLTVGWYLQWRLTATMQPAKSGWTEIGWIWFCLAVELLSIFDQLILYIMFLRTTDRSAEADRHEARIRAMPASQLPSVDVYIPTYNEPLAVLEKTITGALCLDYPNARVWILDDGRRLWLKEFCEAKGVGYLTRPDNAHAKAGNINHALTQTDAEFVAIFDADFIPQQNFLMRTVGFFIDPNIGIMQCPHAFYNHDLMQANLALRKSLPDEQRFFFDVIMPSRDAWDAAFCCGSNSVTRRSALREVGDGLPTESITEDMLLSMALLRKGYVTRYLCERLAFGLAPETVDAFFVQRQRWARGAIQILYLASGPFGRGLSIMQRLQFLPTHWLSLSLRSTVAIVAPIIFLWTGISPVAGVNLADVLYYFLPMVLALAGGVWVFAPRQHFPLASQVQGTFLSFKLLPVVLETVIKPFGHPFIVTPKGGTSGSSSYAEGMFWTAGGLIAVTFLGLIINSIPEWRIIESANVLPIVAFWSVINAVILFMVCMLALQSPVRRGEERLAIVEPVWIVGQGGGIGAALLKDISMSGAGIAAGGTTTALKTSDAVRVFVSEVGFIAGTVTRASKSSIGIQFDLPESIERDLLIRKLFTAGLDTTNVVASGWAVMAGMLRSVWSMRMDMLDAAVETSVEAVSVPPKLPALTLVIAPRPHRLALSEIGEARREFRQAG